MEKVDIRSLYESLIYIAEDESSTLKALGMALTAKPSLGFYRGVMENFLSSQITPEMAYIRWVSDVARKRRKEDEPGYEEYESIYEVLRLFSQNQEVGPGSWRWLYTLTTFMDVVVDRGRRLSRRIGKDLSSKVVEEVGKYLRGEAG